MKFLAVAWVVMSEGERACQQSVHYLDNTRAAEQRRIGGGGGQKEYLEGLSS